MILWIPKFFRRTHKLFIYYSKFLWKWFFLNQAEKSQHLTLLQVNIQIKRFYSIISNLKLKLGEENKSSKLRQNCKRSEERWTLNDSCYPCNWLCNYLSVGETPSGETPWPRRSSRGCPYCVWCPQCSSRLGRTLHWNLLRRSQAVRSLLSQGNKWKK